MKISKETNAAIFHKGIFRTLKYSGFRNGDSVNSAAIAAVDASFHCNASAIIVLTSSG